MREIKYRAWDKDGTFNSGYCHMHYDIQSDQRWDNFIHDEDFIIMQYTGVKDKNGKDVYEGDIVKAYHDELERTTVTAVEFENCCFTLGRYWEDGIHDWYSMEQYTPEDLEVIGSIYETPELLAKVGV